MSALERFAATGYDPLLFARLVVAQCEVDEAAYGDADRRRAALRAELRAAADRAIAEYESLDDESRAWLARHPEVWDA